MCKRSGLVTARYTCWLGSDEANHYKAHSSDWRCQDCNGPQRDADCALSNDGQVIQRHAGPTPSSSGYPASGDGGDAAGAAAISDRSLLARDKDPMDYDMPDGLHAVLPMPPRKHPATVASLAPRTDDMLIDQTTAPPASSATSTKPQKPRRPQRHCESKQRQRDSSTGSRHRQLETKRH